MATITDPSIYMKALRTFPLKFTRQIGQTKYPEHIIRALEGVMGSMNYLSFPLYNTSQGGSMVEREPYTVIISIVRAVQCRYLVHRLSPLCSYSEGWGKPGIFQHVTGHGLPQIQLNWTRFTAKVAPMLAGGHSRGELSLEVR